MYKKTSKSLQYLSMSGSYSTRLTRRGIFHTDMPIIAEQEIERKIREQKGNREALASMLEELKEAISMFKQRLNNPNLPRHGYTTARLKGDLQKLRSYVETVQMELKELRKTDKDKKTRTRQDISSQELIAELRRRAATGDTLARMHFHASPPNATDQPISPLELARQTAFEAKNFQERAVLLWRIAETTRETSDLLLLQKIWDKRMEFGTEMCDVIGSALARACIACGNIPDAVRAVSLLPRPNSRLEIYLELSRSGRTEYLTEARNLARSLPARDRVIAFCKIAVASRDETDVASVQNVLAEALAEPHDSERDTDLRIAIVGYYTKLGKLGEAQELSQGIQSPEACFVARILMAAATQDTREIETLLQEAQEHPRPPKIVHLLLDACLELGNIRLAHLCAATAISPAIQCFCFALICTSKYGNEEDLQEALAAYRIFAGNGQFLSYDPKARTQLIHALMQKKQYDEARTIAACIPGRQQRCRAYLAIHKSLLGEEVSMEGDE